MYLVLEALLPVFLLIFGGAGLRRITLIPDEHWASLERFSYFVFLAPLLILSLYRSQFSEISFTGTAATFTSALFLFLGLGVVLRMPIRRMLGISDASYSSVFQGFTRWNAFIALAIAEKLLGPNGMAVVIIGIAITVLPLNVFNVVMLSWLGEKSAHTPNLVRQLAGNPIIFGSVLGIALKVSGIEIYAPIENTLELLSRATLPVGLILVGVGLSLRLPRSAVSASVACSAVRLVAAPLVYFVLGRYFGLSDVDLMAVTISGSVPTAMSGYLLAKQMGGDAPLMAAIKTLQVVASFFTIPMVILVVQSVQAP